MNRKLMTNAYLGADFSDGIKHWKYVKRERKNGKWVYYYDDSHDEAANKANKQAVIDRMKMSNRINEIKSEYNSNPSKISYNKNKKAQLNGINDLVKYQEKKFKKQINIANAIRNDKEYNTLKKSVDENNKKYNKNNSFKEKAKKIVAVSSVKVLNTASSAINKGKKLLKRLFG